ERKAAVAVDAMADVDVRTVGRDDVETVLFPASGKCGVAGLSEESLVGQHESLVAGHALGLVDRHGVRVREVPGAEVAGGEGDGGAAIEADDEFLAVDRGHATSVAVGDPELSA